MKSKLLLIISTSDLEKAKTATMYVKNALLNNWMEEVKVFFFGPAQKLLLQDLTLQNFVSDVAKLGEVPNICKFISDSDGSTSELTKIGVNAIPVGSVISQYINDGFVPMVW